MTMSTMETFEASFCPWLGVDTSSLRSGNGVGLQSERLFILIVQGHGPDSTA